MLGAHKGIGKLHMWEGHPVGFHCLMNLTVSERPLHTLNTYTHIYMHKYINTYRYIYSFMKIKQHHSISTQTSIDTHTLTLGERKKERKIEKKKENRKKRSDVFSYKKLKLL